MAGYRPTDWHVLDLEKDPTPGDPVRVKSLAKSLHDFADDVQDALRLVKGMADEDVVLTMVGKTADVFRDEFSGVPKNLKKLKKSYDLAGDALAAYWPQLERAQALADKALAQGREAQADLSSAKSRLSSADSWVSRANKEADKYKDDPGSAGKDVPKPDESKVRAATRDAQSAKDAHTSAESDVTTAQNALDAAKKMAADARKMREDAAGDAKRKLDEASDAGIQNRKWYEEVGDWFTDNWDTIVAVCKVVVAVLGVIALIIGGPILGAIVLIAALVVLADTLNKYMKGQASLLDVAFAALDCIPGMKGLTSLGGLAKGLKAFGKTGLKGMAAGVRGLGQGMRSMSRQMKKLFCRTDPVDMATGEVVMSATDVSLPGVLPLVVERHHRTSTRGGRLFGPSWTSTLDQRLLLDATGARLVTADGMVLHYPVPDADMNVLPVEGPRWPLSWDGDAGGELAVREPETGRTLHFRPLPGGPRDELPLASIGDRNGNTISVSYDAEGLPHEVTHDGGYRIGVTCESGRVVALTLRSHPERPTLLRYAYDAQGNLSEIYNSSERPLKLSYDSHHRITGWEDRNSTWYRYTYDDQGRCTATRGAEGALSSTIAYDAEARRTLFTDSLGHTTTYRFNDHYQLLTETDPLGSRTDRTWDRYDNLLTITDPLGRTTAYEYGLLGKVTAVTRADGHRAEAEYNGLGLPERVTTVDSAEWRQSFDEAGNRVTVTDPSGAVTRYAYGERGELASVTDALGHTTAIACDGAGLPVRTVTPLGETTGYRRDAFGRPVEVTDPLGAVTRLEWTIEGKPARHVDPLGSRWTWTWDGEGNCLSRSDAAGGTYRYEYGPFDLPLAQTNPDGSRFAFERDTELRLTSVTNPLGLSWSYTYDPAGQLVAESDFDNRTVGYVHDAAGQLATKVNGLGQEITYTRDAVGRIIEKDAAGTLTTFTYDPADRLIRATSPGAELVLERDPVGRILSETSNGRTTTHEYDAVGQPLRRRTPGGVESAYHYDEVGRPVSLSAARHRLDFAYDAAGREVTRRTGQGVLLDHRWDAAGNLVEQSTGLPDRPLRQRTFSYRDDHHLIGVGVTDRGGTAFGSDLGGTAFESDLRGTAFESDLRGTAFESGQGETAFELDPLGRVTTVTSPAGREDYTYDSIGNQLTAHWPEGREGREATGDRRYTGTRLTRAGGVHYEYDAAGRTTVRRKRSLSGRTVLWRYEWNAEDRLTGVTTPDGTRWQYAYDPLGRRVSKQCLAADGQVAAETRFTWSHATLIEQAAHGTGGKSDSSVLTWDHHGNHPVAQREHTSQREIDARFYAIVTDLVGTPTELIDETGDIVWQTGATLWGVQAEAQDSAVHIPLRFPGQYHDPETGWNYNYLRHYDPEINRYSTPDPLGLEPDPNHYGYVDNPHAWIDPLGLLSCAGRLDKLNPGEMYLYRAVMNGELDQILRTRSFQNPRGIEVKYFSSTPEGAAAYARQMYSRMPDEGPYTMVRSTIRQDAIPEISRIEHLADAGGNIEALAIPTEVLEQMGRIRILPSMPIP
ncbi:DUF6531 domain-containing protein [Streptomyces phaeochromogenes]|uniref:DUF6531 domain-containing protein n=1 Tax=Streptomyces phaeochromogenes TaxID=1923 RepID=UPI0033D80113